MAVNQHYQLHVALGPLTIGLILLALSACTNKEDTNESVPTGLILPQLLQRLSIPSGASLSATITIDKDSIDAVKHDMDVDVSNKRISFSGNLESGVHSFFLELFYNSPSINALRLVSATRTINVTGDQNIGFSEGEYIYDDGDNDNFTNIVEIESNSDPFSASSVPNDSVADDNYEPNNTYASAYDLSSHRGTFFNNVVKTNTSSGRLTLSDNVDMFKITTTDSTNTIELHMGTDYGIFWEVQRLVNGTVVYPTGEITLDEDIGYLHQKAIVTTSPPGDYYLIVYSPSDALVKGTYSFGWN